jgi:hypothetical protein
MAGFKAYFATFAATIILGMAASSIAIFSYNNLGCRVNARKGDEFTAYCQSKTYGDYEHGAFFFGLEPEALANLRKSRVVFLGNSLTQCGFSSDYTRSFFANIDIKFFILGFGYSEYSRFEESVLDRYHIFPQVMVINADPFFSHYLSTPAQDALSRRPRALWGWGQKYLFNRIQPRLCRALPVLCPEDVPAIYRSVVDGEWNVRSFWTKEISIPPSVDKRTALTDDEISEAVDRGSAFIERQKIDRKCVVVTGIPSSNTDGPFVAARLARTLGVKLIQPKIDELATIDGGHLNHDSRERWSSAFLEELAPVLRECLKR